MFATGDPWEELAGVPLAAGVVPAVAQLLLVEHLVGSGRASRIEELLVGPLHKGRRRVRLVYIEPRRASNVAPGRREVEGSRAWR